MRGARGVVLLNALIVVIAVAAIATAMLSLSARATARLSAVQADAQMALYLDGARILIERVLDRDAEDTTGDHRGEVWGAEALSVPIDRGAVAARIADLQGRFNLNDLAGGDADARAGAARLFAALDLPADLLAAVEADLAAHGPAPLIDRLAGVPGMTGDRFARLAAVATALPPGTALNANTARPEVLAAVLPGLGDTGIDRLVASRERAPFADGAGFRGRMADLFDAATLGPLRLEGFAAATAHFEAVVTATLDGRRQSRRLILIRDETGRTRTRFDLPAP